MLRRALTPRAIPAILVGLLGVGGFLLLPGYLLYAGSTALAAGLIGLGLFLPIAALREMPLNAAGIAGLSAYLFAKLATGGGLGNHLAGIGLGLSLAVGLSVLTGLASLVVTGLYFVVASLVVQVGIEKVAFSIPGVTGGAAGWAVSQPDLSGWFDTQRAIYLIVGAIVLLLALSVRALLRSRTGFQTVLVGHVPEGAAAMGLRNWMIKLQLFALSGVLVGIGGLLIAFVNGSPPPVFSFGLIFSVIYVAIPIASGMRELSSIWLVAAAFTAIPILLEPLHLFPNFVSGAILVAALALGQNRERLAARTRRLRPESAEQPDRAGAPLSVITSSITVVGGSEPRPQRQTSPVTLEGRGITVDFGGVRAVDAVSVRVTPGQRVGIVGANGAGKTTLINALTGFVPPQQGRVLLGSTDITGWGPMARARAGIRRSFQSPRLADVLTAEQNVVCVHGYDARHRDRVESLLLAFGLDALRATPVAALSFGQRRKLELVRALATRPQVLILDEPSGGLTDEQGERLAEVLLGLQAIDGWGLLVVEHNPRVLIALSQHLLVLENGRLLVEGPTDVTIRQEEVRRVYLGRRVEVRRVSRWAVRPSTSEPRVTVTSTLKGKPTSERGGLQVRDLRLDYGPMPVLRGVSLDCQPGGIVGVVGGNGVGKTSLLAGIAGLVGTSAGTVHLDGQDISRWPGYRRGQAGMVMIAERRRVLPSLSVRDNLCAGGWGLDQAEVEARVERVLELFPRLGERLDVPAYRLSGGEQRMVSIGRALVTGARCLLFDELSLSLSPRLVSELVEVVRALAEEGRIIVLVEQYIGVLLGIADTTHVLERGRFAFSGPSDDAAAWLEDHGYLAQAEAAGARL
jgi:ABC-type branched-subunit amino acid transport system ATPase component/ABC-type branched-subunit amino acid transport system permease subunit